MVETDKTPADAPELDWTRSERRRALSAAIVSVTVFGLSIGQGGPLLSLLLERRGTDATLTGLNAASTFVGVLLGPLLTPRSVRAIGIRNFLLLCFALEASIGPLLKLFDTFSAWFALRMLLGMIGSSIFTASEALINLLAGAAGRGRVVGLYAAALSLGFSVGPLLLVLTGIDGWLPFIANAAITSVAMLPLFRIGGAVRGFGRERGMNPLVVFVRAPFVVSTVAMFGLFEAAMLVLLPIWGVRLGLSNSFAAATLSAVYIGSVTLQVPIGWLADTLGRLPALRLCGIIGLVGALVLSGAGSVLSVERGNWAEFSILFGLLFFWGGIAASIYPLALSLAGDLFRSADLVAVNAAIIMAYGLGSLAGPTLGGAAMDAWNPQGLLAFFVVLFGAFLFVALNERFARAGT